MLDLIAWHEARKDAHRRDPLLRRLFSSDIQRRFISAVRDRLEALLRSGNGGGKTEVGAALAVSLLQGRTTLDGRTLKEYLAGAPPVPFELPTVSVPCTGYLIVPGYKQSQDSAVKAVLDALGDWPHKVFYATGEGAGMVSLIRVKPIGCTSEKMGKWSKLVVFVDKGIPPTGGRIDFAWADEPPSRNVWEEVRMRGKAGKPFYRFLTLTPLERRFWYWIQEQWAGTLDHPANGRLELKATLYDNEFLTPDDITDRENAVKGDVHAKARLYGDYVDAEGDNPFAPWFDVLDRWESECRDGAMVPFTVRGGLDPKSGNLIPTLKLELEVWEPPEPGETYVMVFDGSSGTRSADHDPACLHVWAMLKPRLVARYGARMSASEPWSGYIPAKALGFLGAAVGKRYFNALADVENNAYGLPILEALRESEYANINRDEDASNGGEYKGRLGFVTGTISRPRFISAIQMVLQDSAYADAVKVWSRDVVSALKGMQFDKNEKPVAGPGKHDEDVIPCMGRACHLLQTRAFMPAKPRVDPVHPFEHALSDSMGRRIRFKRPQSGGDMWR